MPRARTSPLDRVRAICLALPETKETLTWGEPHFRVGEKIFAGCDLGTNPTLGIKLERAHAEAVLDDPRFTRAPYVGRYGWVSLDLSRVTDWDEVRALVEESYRLIAPKRLVKALTASPAAPKGVRARKARR